MDVTGFPSASTSLASNVNAFDVSEVPWTAFFRTSVPGLCVLSKITPSEGIRPEAAEASAIEAYVRALGVADGAEFPASADISAKAREIQQLIHDRKDLVTGDPDFKLIDYTRIEFSIFRELEAQAYGSKVREGFSDVEEFVELANKVLNRRKSRAAQKATSGPISYFLRLMRTTVRNFLMTSLSSSQRRLPARIGGGRSSTKPTAKRAARTTL